MFSFNKGRKFSNQIADHLGIHRGLYSSSLLETGVTWAHLKLLMKTGCSAREAADELMPAFIQGLTIIESRFGPQPTIQQAESVVMDWYNKNQEFDEDGPSDQPDRIVSSEFPSGRYELTYEIETNETFRGKSIGNKQIYVMRSNDLEHLEATALVKRLGGVESTLIDTTTGDVL